MSTPEAPQASVSKEALEVADAVMALNYPTTPARENISRIADEAFATLRAQAALAGELAEALRKANCLDEVTRVLNPDLPWVPNPRQRANHEKLQKMRRQVDSEKLYEVFGRIATAALAKYDAAAAMDARKERAG